jgi:hypothetical protein
MSGTTSTSGSKYLYTLAPVENTSNAAITSGQVQMGNSTYPDSVGAQCYAEPEGSAAVLAYDVNGARFLDATVGVPNDAPDAAGQVPGWVAVPRRGGGPGHCRGEEAVHRRSDGESRSVTRPGR